MTEEGNTNFTPAGPISTQPSLISIEEFQRLSIRTGIVTAATDHPNADRLLVLTVDVGESTPRQLVAGIKGHYNASELVGKCVAVVTNLKPATLRGVESQGMALAATDGPSIVLLGPDKPVRAGSIIK